MKWYEIPGQDIEKNLDVVIVQAKNITQAMKIAKKGMNWARAAEGMEADTLNDLRGDLGPKGFSAVFDSKGKEMNGSAQAKAIKMNEEINRMKELSGIPLNEELTFTGQKKLVDKLRIKLKKMGFKDTRPSGQFKNQNPLLHMEKDGMLVATDNQGVNLVWSDGDGGSGTDGLTDKWIKTMPDKYLSESFKINAPTLTKMANMEYSDPRLKEGCKVVAEKCGKLKKKEEVVEGSYIMYQDAKLPGKYLAVHVSDSINEDSGLADVNVVAIGTSKKNVMERMAYRIRRGKNLGETLE